MAQQVARLTFTGVETSLSITWPVVYANRRYMQAISTEGDIVDVSYTTDDGTTLTVEPTALFAGNVDIINIEVLP